MFGGDSDTVMIDNSTNCIIWRHKRIFDPKSYVKLNTNKSFGVSSAVGKGSPFGIGDLNIGWNDDAGTYHSFVLPKVFHIPVSPVNILDVSAFSKTIGDFNSNGTPINSSGQDSVFSWDNRKYQKTFIHSDSDMPEMTVNDEYASFHRFWNFIQSVIPKKQQYFHTKSKNIVKNGAIYNCGEEVLYKNQEHVEKGVNEKISLLQLFFLLTDIPQWRANVTR